MGVFAGQHGSRTTIGTYPSAAVARAVGNLQQPLPTGILSTFFIRALRDARIQIFLHDTRIEAADDVNRRGVWVTLSTFVVNGSRGVELMEPSRHRCLIRTIAAFVAQTPEDDAGMVLVALSHTDGTIQKGITPIRRRSQRASQTMRLAIGLIHHIHTHRVAKLIPTRTIRIVSQTNGIDVRLLHQSQILKHTLFRHHTSRIGVVLVTVDTTNLDRLSVDEQLPTLDGNGAEPHLLRHALNGFPVEVLKFHQQRIKVGVFDAP